MLTIGACSIDIHKSEREFETLSLSDANVIKWLIMYRDKVDMNFGAEVEFDIDVAGNTGTVNQELITTYALLDDLIEKCEFDTRQRALIDLVSLGFTFKDIEDISINTSSQSARRRFESVCKSIAEMNDYLWLIWVNKQILKTDARLCSRCGEELPANSKFFGRDARRPDGMQSICKKCDSNRRKSKDKGFSNDIISEGVKL